ncbi:MAG: DAK2 domain-containing protein [Chloroflexota bacterium]
MDNNTQVDVATILNTIAGQLQQNRSQLNQVDGAGTHGERIAQAFNIAAQAASQAGSDDAGQQLEVAAQAMRRQGKGKATAFYAQGLEAAAGNFSGKSGIGLNDLAPFLQSFLGGVEKNNPAKPGQGTMLDALGPAVTAFVQGQSSGNPQQAIAQSLGAAMQGTARTGTNGAVDPGAASVTNVLGGIFSAVAPQLLGMLLSGRGRASGQGQTGGGFDLGGLLGGLMGGNAGAQAAQPQSGGNMGWLTGLLGGLMGGTASQGGGNAGAGGMDLGGLLGGFMGGQNQGQANQPGDGSDLGNLLGGFMGGQDQGQSGQSQGGGMDLGGLLGGLMGGQDETQNEDPNRFKGKLNL